MMSIAMALQCYGDHHLCDKYQLNKKPPSYEGGFVVVGLAGFEPTTPCPPGKCATRLRYSPNSRNGARRKPEPTHFGK